MVIFDKIESKVQSYGRNFPAVFTTANGEFLYDNEGNEYLDFLAGAGSINYGHNNPIFREQLLKYISEGRITHSLDLYTLAKAKFMETFNEKILKPRGFDYRLQFTGPTGTNAVEAALKIARNYTGRKKIISYTNGFHGVSLGALATTGNSYNRNAAGIELNGVIRMPYDGYLGEEVNTNVYLEKVLSDASSGIELPAAIILETVQGEGGINACSSEWLRELQGICKKYDILLIVDDIQAGCGRTGNFFSFEKAGIQPDIVTMSKSLSGYGLPFAVVLLRPEYDIWKPGEHNGTFRGNNLAFVTAKSAIDTYWSDDNFEKEIQQKGNYVRTRLESMVEKYGKGEFKVHGRGMFQGLNCISGKLAKSVTQRAFEKGLIIERSGAEDQVIKVFCPLTIQQENLKRGLDIIEESLEEVCGNLKHTSKESNYSLAEV